MFKKNLVRGSQDFCWATGIEDTFIPQVRPGMRRLDEYELTQPYQFWKEDFDLLAETGVRAVRWGIPWYRVQPGPKKWDWSWTDAALDYLVNVKGILPILDLMHYGTPLWLDNSFINASYPERVGEYAAAVAERYGSLVNYYTPLNEPMVNADWCGYRGDWPPYLKGDDGLVKLTLAIGRGLIHTVQAIRAAQPQAVLVQVEALWRFSTQIDSIKAQVALRNERQYLCLDLTTGRVDNNHPMCGYLSEHGVQEADLEWFRSHAVKYDLLGANFYPWSYGKVFLRRDGLFNRLSRNIGGHVIAEVLQDAYTRYKMPIMVTETSARRDLAGRARWMDETIAAVLQLRSQGVPVVGYTWFPFFSMISWFYRRSRHSILDYLIHLGLVDADFDAGGVFQRRKTVLVERYQAHMSRPVPPLPEEITI